MNRTIQKIIQLGNNHYKVETRQGTLITITYNGSSLTFMYEEAAEDQSFSIEKSGLTGIWEFLNIGNYTVHPECSAILLQPERPEV